MYLSPYQIFTPLLAFAAIYYAWSLVLRQKKTIWEAMLWTFFWGYIAAISVFPSLLQTLKVLTGIRDAANAVFVTSLGIIAFIAFALTLRVEELHQRQIKLIRQQALKDAKIIE